MPAAETCGFVVETSSRGPLVILKWLASREAGIWVVGHELLRSAFVDESLVEQPLDGPALGSNITQGVPRRNQLGVSLIDLVLESSKRSPPLQRLSQVSPDDAVADALSEVGHVLKPHIGRKRIDDEKVQLVDLDRVHPVDACVAGPERQLARAWVDQPSVLVVSLIRQCGCDLLNVDSAKFEHPLRVELERNVWRDLVSGIATARELAAE
jgi:hypothetical protein